MNYSLFNDEKEILLDGTILIVYDQKDIIIKLNSNFINQSGYKESEIIGCNILQISNIVPDYDGKYILELNTKMGNPIKFKCTIRRINNNSYLSGSLVNNEKANSNKFNSLIFNNSNIGLSITAKDSTLLKVNNKLCELLGYTEEELIGKSFLEFTHTDDILFNQDKFDSLISGICNNYEMDKRFIRKDGSIAYIRITTCRIVHTVESYDCFFTSYQDFSDQYLSEQRIMKQNVKLSLLYSSFRKVAENVDLNELLNATFKTIVNMYNFNSAAIYMYEDDNLKYTVGEGFSNNFLLHYAKLTSRNYPLNKINLPTTIRVEDLKYKEDINLLKHESIDKLHVFPFIASESTIGMLIIGSNENFDLGSEDQDFIFTLCNQFAVLIQNAQLYRQVKVELKGRQETEEELGTFFATTIDLMAIMDFKGNIKSLSKDWAEKIGYNNSENLILKYTHPDDHNKLLLALKSVTLGNDLTGFQNRLIMSNGQEKVLEWSARALTDREIIVCTARDITESIKIQEKNRELQSAIQLDNIRTDFFANISHEFRTPLNIIISTMQLLEQNLLRGLIQGKDDPKLNKFLKSIKQNSFRMLRLVSNLIDITKIDTGYYQLIKENLNIVQLIEDITLSVSQFIQGKGLDLIFDTDIEEKLIACDPDKIERVMLNLLSNAVKFSNEGGKIRVNVKCKNNEVWVTIKDNGRGISKEALVNIFDRFIQEDKSLTRLSEGSGIGLSLVKSLVELHGGTIKVSSWLGQGSEFKFMLPVQLTNKNNNKKVLPDWNTQVHKINIEFSDIYSLDSSPVNFLS